MARVCEGEGADGLALINTVQAMRRRRREAPAGAWNGLGGLSGPAIRPIALRMVYQAARAVRIPICGIGGIASGGTRSKFLLCGASAVQVGTANYLNPLAALEVARRHRGPLRAPRHPARRRAHRARLRACRLQR